MTAVPPPRAGLSAPILDIEGLGKQFGGFHALRDVDLVVNEGEILGIIGPNGAARRRCST